MARVWRPMWRSVLGAVARKYQNADPSGGAWTPTQWFLASEQGVWYDPSDMSTLFQDSAGTIPVTAVEQPVGLALDKRLGLVRGPELWADGSVSFVGSSSRVSAGVYRIYSSDGSYSFTGINGSLVIGKTYEAVFTVDSVTTAGTGLAIEGFASSPAFTGAGRKSAIFVATATTFGIKRAGTACDIQISNVSIRELPGNHASQISAASRPVLSARKNKLLATTTLATQSVTLTASPHTLSFKGTGTVTLTGASTAGPLVGTGAGNRVSLTFTPTAGSVTFTVSGSVTEAQLEDGSAFTTYQRVNTATEYDTVGFPHYFALDLVDDHVTVAAGGGGTTGICICAAIRAGGAGNARTIWSDRGTNTGYRLSINASNQLVLSAGNGSAHTEVIGPTVTAGTDYVVTGWHDGTNLNVQLNAGAATSAAFGTATAGTAGFTIGKDNGAATGYYGERIYEILYRKNDTSSAGDRARLITYMAAQAGITL